MPLTSNAALTFLPTPLPLMNACTCWHSSRWSGGAQACRELGLGTLVCHWSCAQHYTWAGSADGCSCKYCAATPLTCGHAMEVPVALIVALGVVYLQPTRSGSTFSGCMSSPCGINKRNSSTFDWHAASPPVMPCTCGPSRLGGLTWHW